MPDATRQESAPPEDAAPVEDVAPPAESRFVDDPAAVLPVTPALPPGWTVARPDAGDPAVVERLTALLRDHEARGRGWPGSDEAAVLGEIGVPAERTRANVVVLDGRERIQAWGSVHDRAGGRMLLVHVVSHDLPTAEADACASVLVDWAVAQAAAVGSARGLDVQQIDTGAFAADERLHAWLAAADFAKVRTWWQMSRPAQDEDADLVTDPHSWERSGVRFRLVRRDGVGLPEESDLRAVHEILEDAFTDHFNSWAETFDEFLHRLREDPGHRWDHWWLAELVDRPGEPIPVGALVGTVSESQDGPDGSYVSYLGVLGTARGRGVAKGLLHSIVADAASRGRDRVGLEVDADSSTRAQEIYSALGWRLRYVTESWHRDVPIV
ncbi:GNAT family N-acetyltransferase [Serinibacter arcticus]|uniref:GNAT family N-acetyltransferase n=1 Tax=Serinibacter arcticus TaxID=1655435 RepID=A0A2U1ZRV9_9MICO|nr:GNAT family N-acetyltransferase [Serinibacter arcticus]PWD49717.1 GNAT family N-acetyltransferase [Serinibacter arcticus]